MQKSAVAGAFFSEISNIVIGLENTFIRFDPSDADIFITQTKSFQKQKLFRYTVLVMNAMFFPAINAMAHSESELDDFQYV